jgi:hypothetical protein
MIMKIDRRMFPASTTVVVGSNEYGLDYSNNKSEWYTEWLYKKKNGQFFLHTEYDEDAEKDDYLEKITESDAKEWAEKHLSAESYEEIFGTV